jgi:hypothetical protein
MNTEGTGYYTCKECHNTESLYNHTTTVHKETERLGDRRNAGESSCNSGDGTGQMAQPLMFMMMMTFTLIKPNSCLPIKIILTFRTVVPKMYSAGPNRICDHFQGDP